MLTDRDAVISAVAYSDIFDYPLTEEEVKVWLILRKGYIPFTKVRGLEQVQQYGQNYHILPKRSHLIPLRKRRYMWSEEKWRIALRASRWVSLIPTVMLIGITGALAMHNTRKNDDIDLFFIVSPGTLWMSRLLVTGIVECMGVRRRPTDVTAPNKVCLNMFMTADALSVDKKERDLFTAHEVLQMQPLYIPGDVYQRFLFANRWVKKFLPNAWHKKTQSSKISAQGGSASGRKAQNHNVKVKSFAVLWFSDVVLRFEFCVLRLFETPSKLLQLWYMRQRRTTEVVSDQILRFHPRDARIWIKQKFRKRLDRYNVPLDKIFYSS